MIKKELGKLLDEYLSDEGLSWVVGFLIYCNSIDDIIDGDKTDSEFIMKTFGLALDIYSSPFYCRHCGILYPLIKATGNAYMDSVQYERTEEPWKKAQADVLRQFGNEVICACVEICGGYDKKREFSLKLRELSYHSQHPKE